MIIIIISHINIYTLYCLSIGDIGGSLALFLGVSILTVCEFLDFLLHGAAYYQDIQRQTKQQQQVHYHYYDSTDFKRAPSNESKTSGKSQTGNGHPGDFKLGSGDSYVWNYCLGKTIVRKISNFVKWFSTNKNNIEKISLLFWSL